MKIKIKALRKGCQCPVKAHKGDAGYDLYTAEDVEVYNNGIRGFRTKIPLGFAIEIPDPCSRWYWKVLKVFGFTPYRYFARIRSRSGLTLNGMEGKEISQRKENGKNILRDEKRYDCDVKDGVVDCNYRKEVAVLIVNRDNKFFIPKGTKIAQMTIEKAYEVNFEYVAKLSPSERDGGFGSTGTR